MPSLLNWLADDCGIIKWQTCKVDCPVIGVTQRHNGTIIISRISWWNWCQIARWINWCFCHKRIIPGEAMASVIWAGHPHSVLVTKVHWISQEGSTWINCEDNYIWAIYIIYYECKALNYLKMYIFYCTCYIKVLKTSFVTKHRIDCKP